MNKKSSAMNSSFCRSLGVSLLLALMVVLPGNASDGVFFATVHAPSGVNLRKAPSRNSAILRKLGQGTSVEVFGKAIDPENIDGKSDNWFKVAFKDDRGWVFGANLAFEKPDVRDSVELYGFPMMKTGEFHGDAIEAQSGEEWVGLFPLKDNHIWKKVRVEVSPVHDPVIDSETAKTGKRVAVPGEGEPVFLLKEMKIPTAKEVKLFSVGAPQISKSDPPFPGRKDPDNILYFGTKIEVMFGTEKYDLRVFPDSPPDSGKVATDATVILSRGGFRQEILRVRNYHPEDPQMKILHAGDFDDDGKLDLLLDESNHYNLTTMVLFLSSKAGKGELVKRVAYFGTIGC